MLKQICMLVVIGVCVSCSNNNKMEPRLSPGDQPPEKFNLALNLERLNKRLPEMVLNGIQFDSARAGSEGNVVFYYSLTDLQLSDIQPEEFKKQHQAEHCASYKTSPTWFIEIFRLEHIPIRYQWFDRNGSEVCSYQCE